MAATVGQQGVTKQLSGANAAFNDKVSFSLSRRIGMIYNRVYRANQWNYGYRIWLLLKVST